VFALPLNGLKALAREQLLAVRLAGQLRPEPPPNADRRGTRQYQCVNQLHLGNASWRFTNSDAAEDYYEASTFVSSAGVRLYVWRCYGD
jgi:hypothetical protein